MRAGVSSSSGHAGCEHGVGRVDHLAARAEIFPQQDAPRRAVGRGFPIGVTVVFFGKDGGIRQTEAVDRLLDVAHQKQVLPVAGDGAEDRVLHTADVLIFVHHDLGIARGHLAGERRGRAVLLCQQPGGKMLQIGIVQHRQAALVFGVLLIEAQRQAQQRLHGVMRQAHAAQHRFGGGGERLFHALAGGFAGLPPGLDGFRKGRVGTLAQPLELREGNGQALARTVPARAQRAGKLPQRVGSLLHAWPIGREDLFLRTHGGDQAFHFPCPVIGALPKRGKDLSAPRRLRRVVGRSAEALDALLRPLLRTGMALHFLVKFQDKLAQSPVIPSRAHRVGEAEEAGIGRGVLIALLHDLFQCRALHGGGAVVLQDAKVRRQAQQMSVLAQQLAAEAVDRTDLGPADQRALAAQMAVGGIRGDGGR